MRHAAVVREVEEITARLLQLKEMAHIPASSRKAPKSVPAAKTQPAWPAAKRPKKRAKAPITAERQKTMQLQGRYLGLMRKMPTAELTKFKAMIPKVGKEEVVKRMESYVRKHEAAVARRLSPKRGGRHGATSKKK